MTKYRIDIEIFEGEGGALAKKGGEIVYPDVVKEGICAWMYRGDGTTSYKQGDTFSFPEEQEKLCPFVRDSISTLVKGLKAGKTYGWTYEGTPYEKVIDPEGVTTEFVRCVDPTASGIVVKLVRTKIDSTDAT